MSNVELLKQAINQRSPVSFRYVSPGKDPGYRVGNPHAVFYKDGNKNIGDLKLDIYQTSGVSDSEDLKGKALPGWRLFFVRNIEDLKILNVPTSFSIAPGYNAGSDRYIYSIAKI